MRRHVTQHIIAKSIFGGNYVGPVKERLSPAQDCKLQALELGTNSGTWIQAMAAEFPHVQFRTIDVVPRTSHAPPPNVIFEVYDFTEKLQLKDDMFDMVFLNSVIEVAKDYRAVLREVHRVLRPGGLIYMHEYNPGFWDPEDISVPAYRTNPLGCHFFSIVRGCISSMGVDPDTCDKLPQWLAPGSDLWDQGQGGFKDIQQVVRTFPPYPHEGYPCMERIDETLAPYLRYMAGTALGDMSGLVKDSGLTDEEAENLINGALEELKHHENCVVFKVYCVYATKV